MITSSLVCSPRMGRPISAMRLSSSSLLVSGCLSSYSSVKGKGKRLRMDSILFGNPWILKQGHQEGKKSWWPTEVPGVMSQGGENWTDACHLGPWSPWQQVIINIPQTNHQPKSRSGKATDRIISLAKLCHMASMMRESPRCSLGCRVTWPFVHILLAHDEEETQLKLPGERIRSPPLYFQEATENAPGAKRW